MWDYVTRCLTGCTFCWSAAPKGHSLNKQRTEDPISSKKALARCTNAVKRHWPKSFLLGVLRRFARSCQVRHSLEGFWQSPRSPPKCQCRNSPQASRFTSFKSDRKNVVEKRFDDSFLHWNRWGANSGSRTAVRSSTRRKGCEATAANSESETKETKKTPHIHQKIELEFVLAWKHGFQFLFCQRTCRNPQLHEVRSGVVKHIRLANWHSTLWDTCQSENLSPSASHGRSRKSRL